MFITRSSTDSGTWLHPWPASPPIWKPCIMNRLSADIILTKPCSSHAGYKNEFRKHRDSCFTNGIISNRSFRGAVRSIFSTFDTLDRLNRILSSKSSRVKSETGRKNRATANRPGSSRTVPFSPPPQKRISSETLPRSGWPNSCQAGIDAPVP